jgi:hypothetical protein
MSPFSVEQAVLLDLYVLQELTRKYQPMFAQLATRPVRLVLSLSITALLAPLVCTIYRTYVIQVVQQGISTTMQQVFVHCVILNVQFALDRPLFVHHAQLQVLIKHF